MKRIFFSCVMVAFAALSVTLSSCVKKSFDSPPNLGATDPNIPVTMTIGQLRDIAIGLGGSGRVLGDSTIAGIVVADDRSGNLYKEIIIQDTTGGITLLIDQNNLYADYPVGMKVYVKLKGLYIGTYNKLPELGYSVTSTGITKITSLLAPNYIIKGSFPNTITTKHYTFSQLVTSNTNLLNTLITIDSVEFAAGSYGIGNNGLPITYATAVNTGGPASTTLNIETCNTPGTLQLYNSGYATFQAYPTPSGRGSITCIYSIYGSTPQLLMRDTTDVHFTGPRCGAGSDIPNTTIGAVRDLYNAAGAPIKLGASVIIGGIITATPDSANFSSGSYIIQSGSRAISVYYGNQPPSIHLGDSVAINISGDSVISYKGSLEVKYGSPTLTYIKSTGNTVTPVTITIADLNAQYGTAQMEYTLVKIVNGTVTGGGTYSGNKSLTDGTGTISLYTSTSATFATQTVPSTAKSFTGIVSAYNGSLELQLRGPSIDVQ